MLQYCPDLHLYLVDTDDNAVLKEAIKPFGDRVEFICKKSVDAAKTFSDRYFDYVYIDGEHVYRDVTDDLLAWFPKCKKGGVMSGHDWWYNEVQLAVSHFFLTKPEMIFGVQQNKQGTIRSVDAQMCDWWCKKV
jgi:hypothetical protein